MNDIMESIEVNGIKYVRADLMPPRGEKGPLVLVRTVDAGVHVGEMVRRVGSEITLANVRRLWRWYGANTLNEVSQNGVDLKSNISEPAPENTILGVIEVLPVSAKAAPSLTRSGWGK